MKGQKWTREQLLDDGWVYACNYGFTWVVYKKDNLRILWDSKSLEIVTEYTSSL